MKDALISDNEVQKDWPSAPRAVSHQLYLVADVL